MKNNIEVYVMVALENGGKYGRINEIQIHPTIEKACQAMYKSVAEHYNVPLEEVFANGETDDFEVGSMYATSKHYDGFEWEIVPVEIPEIEKYVMCQYIMEQFDMVGLRSYKDIIFKLLDEKKKTLELTNEGCCEEFMHESFIGESLYENALEQLGGKTDDDSTETIHEYLNTMGIDNRGWIMSMLDICAGHEPTIKDVRYNIDKDRPIGQKIFDETLTLNIKIPQSQLGKLKMISGVEIVE